ncbi:ribokinase [Mycolicibacterium tusciae]|uniref:ribokinase n=1 Tax=Mycolicibacterium tusciae TaxID=75922 RepID=UPI00024A2DE7|nr:ribokinase [Mycolicibacterium tusciae]
MREKRVFVVGSLNADHRVRVRDIPKPGETVLGSNVVVAAGGKGANQAVAAARAGARAVLIGATGADRDGELVRRTVAEEDVDARHVRIVLDTPTGRALITVDREGENTIVVSPGANSELVVDDIDAGLQGAEEGDLLLLQLETPQPLVRHAARAAADAACTVIMNAAPVPPSVNDLFNDVDVLVVNEHELAMLADLLRRNSNDRDRDADMGLLAAESGATVVCTAGDAGAFVTHDGAVKHIAAHRVDAVDATAAGDTFIGYFAAALTTTANDTIMAIQTAVAASALAVTRPGAIDSIPYRHEAATTPPPTRRADHENRAG